jgi:very-short-patch-repair endonuclease
MPNNIVCKKRWCNICTNKTEKKLYEYLSPLYPSIIKEFKRDWCKRINHLPFDFCIEEHHIIIELDGRQHFIQVSNWDSPEQQQDNDKYKMQKANENGYSVIRIIQEDVLFDSYDWKTELQHNIQQIITTKTNLNPNNIFMCANEEYTITPLAIETLENLVVKPN